MTRSAMPSSHATAPGRVLVTIAGLTAALAALVLAGIFAWMSLGPLREWQQSRHWPEVTANIRSVNWLPATGPFSGRFQVAAEYDYAYEGREYRGRRLGLTYPWLFLTQNHQLGYYRILQKAHQQGRTIFCYVDPADPRRALLFRDLWIGPVVFPAIGAVLTGILSFALFRTFFRQMRRRRLRSAASAGGDASTGGPDRPAESATGPSPATGPGPASAPLASASPPLRTEVETFPQLRQYQDAWGNRWVRVSCWPGHAWGIGVILLALTAAVSAVLLGAHALVHGGWEWLLVLGTAVIAVLLGRLAVSFLGAYHVRLSSADLHVIREWGFLARHRSLPLPYAHSISCVATATLGGRRLYAIVLNFSEGKSVRVAAGIRSEQAARWLTEAITALMPRRLS